MMNCADTLFDKQLPIALGPMAGVTDLPFRFLCRTFGTDLTFTEMVSAKALYYKNKNTEAEENVIYLYDITAKHVIAKYQNVRYAKVEKNEETGKEYGVIDSSKIIVQKNNLWGIDEVIKGKVTNFEDYQYKYIKFDKDTNLYILKTQNDRWQVENTNTKYKTSTFLEKIDSLYYKNDKIYVIAYILPDEYSKKKNYLLYNQDGENVLYKDGIDDLKAFNDFLVYTNDLKLYIINYDGKEVINNFELYFDDSYTRIKSYYLRIENDTLIVSTPKESEKTHFTNEYYYRLKDFSLIRERKDVKETIE